MRRVKLDRPQFMLADPNNPVRYYTNDQPEPLTQEQLDALALREIMDKLQRPPTPEKEVIEPMQSPWLKILKPRQSQDQ